jgi:outer membrane receptor for ferrienterochelin and colicins
MPMKQLKKCFILIHLLLGCAIFGYTQKAMITVKDARNKEPIAFANIILENTDHSPCLTAITDFDGKTENLVKSKSLITVTYVGYKPYNDTIFPDKNLTVLLDPQVYNMDEVVVTGQYTPQAVDKSIFRVKVIGSRQIDQRASNNLNDLMAGELNIRSSNDGALGSKITMQGLGGEHIKFLIDGVPVIGRMNGNIDLGQLNLYNVEHIEVIEGPMSVIYGSNALAGVINIITKENKNTRYTTNANAYLESVGVYNFSADASIKKNRLGGSIALARNFFDGYSTYDTTRYQSWKPKRQYNVDAALNYSHKDLKAGVSASYFNELLIDKGNLIKPYYETAFDNHFKTNRLTTKFDLSKRVLKDRYLTVLGSYSIYDRVKNTYFTDLTTLESNLTTNTADQDTSKFNQYLLRAEFSKSNQDSKLNYQLGFDLNYENGAGKRILDQKQSQGDYAAYLSMKISPIVRFMIQPGLRYSYNTKYAAPLVYSLNLKWDIREELSLRGSYAKGFRAPSIKELYLEFVDVNHNIRGNENLEAEHSQNINISLKYNHEKETYDYGLEMSLFYNNINHSISLASVDFNSSLYTYVNVDNMITQGFQLNFNNRIYPWLDIKLGYGETGRKQIFRDNVTYDMVYSSDVVANVNYLWRKTDVSFSVFYKYNGAYPEVFLGDNGSVYQTIMESYNTLDVSVSRWFWNNRLNAQFGAKNLFDNTNINLTGDTGGGGIHGGSSGSSPVAWGRTYFVKLALALKKF